MKRPSWDEYWLGVAQAVSLRATCSRRMVGAVVVRREDHRILGSGYNGAVPGAGHCVDGHCPRGRLSYEQLPAGADYSNCIAVHAEDNAIRQAVGAGVRPGDLIYITDEPCYKCAELIKGHGLVAIWEDHR